MEARVPWAAVVIADLLFGQPRGRLSRLIAGVVLALLWLGGAIHWIWFFTRGRMSFVSYDWPLYSGFFSTLAQALAEHRVPWHIAGTVTQTDRFLAIPFTPLSPQVLLLAWLPPGSFVVWNTLLLYSAGFAGCLLLRRKFGWSLFPFVLFFALFNFNGFITAHLSVGHAWAFGYFLLPFFLLLLFDWPAGAASPANCLAMALVLTAILVQGSLHVFVWCLLALLIVALLDRRQVRPFLLVVAVAALLGSFRLAPGFLTYFDKGVDFISGFPTLRHLFDGLTALRDYLTQPAGDPLGWFEFDYFIGLAGLAFILFGVIARTGYGRPVPGQGVFEKLAAILTVFSLSHFYLLIWATIPLARAERASSRLFILPLLVLLVLSTCRLQQWLPWLRAGAWRMVLALALAAQACFELLLHSSLWRLGRVEAFMGPKPSAFALADYRIVVRSDPWYTGSVKLFAVVSLLSFAACVVMLLSGRLRSAGEQVLTRAANQRE